MNRDQIREVFLKNGFTIKDGETDLKPYAYAAAEELLKAAEAELSPSLSALVEALDQCITSMLDSGYRADAVVIRAARYALAYYRNQGGES